MSHNWFWQLPNQSYSSRDLSRPKKLPGHLRPPSGSPKPWPSFKCATVSISMVSSRREPRLRGQSLHQGPIRLYYMYIILYIYIWSILEYPSSQRLTQRTSNLFVAKSQCSRLKSQLFNLLSRVQWWKIPSFGWWTNKYVKIHPNWMVHLYLNLFFLSFKFQSFWDAWPILRSPRHLCQALAPASGHSQLQSSELRGRFVILEASQGLAYCICITYVLNIYNTYI